MLSLVSARTIILCATLLFVAGASAQDVDVVDEITVHATRVERPLSRIPASVSVVNQEDIQLGRQQLGLDESLGAVAGIFVQDRYNFAQDLRIAIRGFGARSNFGIRGVKIIVDGIPETLPDGQGQVDAIDVGSVERIEIVKGPASSLYGNASGGVIAIDSERGPPRPFVESRLAFGADDFSKYQLKAGGQTGKLNYMFDVSDLNYDGYRAHSETENTQLNGRLSYAFDDSQSLKVIVNSTDQPIANDPGGVDSMQALTEPRSARQRNVDFAAGESLEQQKLGLVYEKTIADAHTLQLRNYYVSRDFANRLPFTDGGAVEIDRLFIGGGASYTWRGDLAGRAHEIIVGVDVDRQDDDRRRFDNDEGTIRDLVFDQNETVTSVGVYVQDELTVSHALALTLGLRFDRVEFDATDHFVSDGDDSGTRSLSELSPMLGLAYTASPVTTVFANVSTAFETPTTTEFANPSGAGGFNPALEPQLATSVEVGIRGSHADRHRYELSLFRIAVEDELIPFELAAQPGRDFFRNAGKSNRTGAEIALQSRPVDSLRLSLAYTYSDFVFDRFVDGDGNDFSSNRLPGVPKQLLRGEVKYSHPSGAYALFDASRVGDVYLNNANSAKSDAYVVANLRAGFAAKLGAWRVAPFAGINNVFDERYASNLRINAFGGRYFEPAPGRHGYAGVALRYDF